MYSHKCYVTCERFRHSVALKAASLNYTGLILHTREYAVSYHLFDPSNVNDSHVKEDHDESPGLALVWLDQDTQGYQENWKVTLCTNSEALTESVQIFTLSSTDDTQSSEC